ncbi:sugar ABC transporter ATP-binding protein [Halalkalibacter sp. APA_J-10(15)]|uniref:sugar ABC transporter ATP-binding protein n=1 Tax=Halalkalibacter sp. APA_J-10(15) TaxID=2933805 RepID=UPI001FF2F434|nr:sugar ABC transporter ATP-binding protein [Halalkalibacter sp. APA_J-10(15)]MCK0470494.1 sugar ABC transporter ATP-binding protein [Halalkalibacter sp. APA_J-10(15)]
MSENLLRMDGISKNFPGVRALSNVHFDLNSGEVHAILGENGAGKSTLMKILTGIYEKDEGTITYCGEEVEITNMQVAQDLGISIIHQELNLMPDLTVAQNIFIGREPRRKLGLFLDEQELNRNTLSLFDQLNLQINPKSFVSELSVAKQQMVEIAKALSFRSKILIMDEPTAALTNSEIDRLFSIIADLKKQGVGIIYISHRMEELKRITDRVTILRDGTYIDTFQTKGVSIDQLITKMVGRKIDQQLKPNVESRTEEVVLDVRQLCNRELEHVSFHLKKGEIVGFAGLMGAGRTEVARAVFGADPITSGEIYVKGKKVTIKNPNDAVRHGIGYVSEDRKQLGLMVDMDVKTNIIISSIKHFLYPFGWTKDQDMVETARAVSEQLTIKTPSVHQQVKFLSGGNQQKVVIAKWLTRDCDILIFDEPTRGIDVGAKGEIYKLMNELAKQGKAIIMISSELPEILRMSHRVIVMCEGRISGELDYENASQEAIMTYATKRKSMEEFI